MNIEETKKAIEVMQAFVDGKAVQHFDRVLGWRDFESGVNQPMWFWGATNYRIKPVEPKEIWVNEYPATAAYICHSTKEDALDGANNHVCRKAVHYREVIE